MKVCKTCGEEKPLDEFSRHGSTRDRRQTSCKACRAEWLRQHRRENPDKWTEYNRRYNERNRDAIRERSKTRYASSPDSARRYFARKIARSFGISLAEYDAIVAQRCAICGATESIVLDHCHETGRIRGPLCQRCNTGIGKLGDDPARLRLAADYLEKHRQT